MRSYLSFVATTAKAPLVMLLHGYGSSPKHAAGTLELDRVAKALDVHIVVPEGTPDRSDLRFWHANGACCDFDRTGIDDVAALRQVLDDFSEKHEVSRRFVVGYSNGAFMAHRLGCDASDVIDGFAAFAGVGFWDESQCKPQRPLAMLQVHGTADRAVRYKGGHVLGRRDVDAHPGALSTMTFWAKHNQCSKSTTPAPPHRIANKPTPVVHHSGCLGGTQVALWTVTGGGHNVVVDRVTLEAAIRFLLRSSKQ